MAESGIEEEIEFDPFREDYPEHEVVSVGSMVAALGQIEPPDTEAPEPKRSQCHKCSTSFLAKAGWFLGKWRYAAICSGCADGNSLPAGFLDECLRPRTRQLECPKCGITRGTEPRLKFNLWSYELTCAQCGTYAVSTYRLKRKCASCQEPFFVNEKHPIRECSKCSKKQEKAGPF